MANDPSRRKFLSLSFLAGLFLIPEKFRAAEASGEKIKMLTRDGKLVEVDRSVISTAQKTQATKSDILHWMHPGIPDKKK